MRIEFKESDHSYHANGNRYISMTTICSRFKTPFDSLAVATKVTNDKKSKYFGRDIQEVMDEWSKSGDDACRIGTNLHKKKEIANLGYIPEDNDIKTPIRLDYENLEDGSYPELLLWNHEYSLAGQADLVILETVGLKTYVDIIDFKSNKKLDLNSYKDWKTGHKMMQGPLKHLQDCHYSHYNLQLSGYAWMMEQHGFIPRNLIVEHYPLRTVDGEVDYEQEPVIYKMNYLKKEIVDMLRTYKQTKK